MIFCNIIFYEYIKNSWFWYVTFPSSKLDFLKKGTLVEIEGTPFAKGYLQEDNSVKTEIRLNVSKTNILRPGSQTIAPKSEDDSNYNEEISDSDDFNDSSRAIEEIEEDLF